MVLEDVFRRRGMMVLSRSARQRSSGPVTAWWSRWKAADRPRLALPAHGGMVPATRNLGLEEAGSPDGRGFVEGWTGYPGHGPRGVPAGDCTGVMMLASVAAMQGRIAMWHAAGEAVQPIRLDHVAATIFTDPEIATVGVTANAVESGAEDAVAVKLPLATNARAKMQGFRDGFVKLFARRGTGIVLGGVVVAPRASELILGVSRWP
jgi:dihydrolipoamide dehydrogenase